ncbi:MAG TPA: 50S ribosomal protein L25 [Candidatus Saccharimonadales bacterium]|nr:50S ribosomal protein L25 [Candidatus Saccharimonadales bacterium]
MGEKVELTVETRDVTGKKVASLRRDGYVPAVVYGHDFPAQSVMAETVPMTKAVRIAGKHHPIELQIGSDKRLAMIKTTDFDPVKRGLRHVAFHVVKQNEEVETEIPVVVLGVGETPAEKAGLVVLTGATTVEVKALPNNLPDQLEVDGQKLAEVGDNLTVADITVPKGVTILSDPEQVVASTYEPSALQAANEAAGGDAEVGDEAEVEAEEGADTPQETQAEEGKPGGKKQFEPKGE